MNDSIKQSVDTRAHIEDIIKRLNAASAAYYGGSSEKMTDFEWDALFDELKKIEDETGIILENSPTHNVSSESDFRSEGENDTSDDEIQNGQREEHEFPALSLAKTKNPEELVKWAENRPVWLSWKLDGLTLVVTYDNGQLKKVVTRGNGHAGNNITHLAAAINGILPTVKEKGHMVIRGEAVISYEDFEKFRLEAEEDYANPRNLASGSLSLKDPEEVKKRKITWIPFTLVYTESDITSWGDRMDYLEEQGFKPVERELIDKPSSENIHSVIDKWTEKVTSDKNPYPVDGLVISYDDTEYAQTGSVTGHHATRAGYAFKWQDEAAETTLRYIEWSCAASTITPVAVFEPVELEGTTVKRASLCNISECQRLGIGDAGTEISVIKANKIIPKVIKVNRQNGKLNIPGKCPVCGADTDISVSEQSGTMTLRCTNPKCTAKELRKFSRFVSKPGTDIDGISESTLDRFINQGWVKNFADIYKLMDHSDEMSQLDGFGEKSVQNLKESIYNARKVDDTRMVFALCIPLVGPDVAKRLLSVHSFNELFEIARSTDDEEIFSSIDGIGPEKSSAIVKWCHDSENIRVLELLEKEVEIIETEKTAAGDRCRDLTFVVTGDVHYYKNRNELKAYIESQGGNVTGSVSKSTDYLINNDIESTSGKNKKARTLGIPVISEDDFREKFGE